MGSVQFPVFSSTLHFLELIVASTKCLWRLCLYRLRWEFLCFCCLEHLRHMRFPIALCCSSSSPTCNHTGSGVVCTFKNKTYNQGDSWHPYLEPFGLMFCMRCVCTEVPFHFCSSTSEHLNDCCTKQPDQSAELKCLIIRFFRQPMWNATLSSVPLCRVKTLWLSPSSAVPDAQVDPLLPNSLSFLRRLQR